MFPIINVWGFFSDNGSFSLTFSHVLPVSLFKSNSSSASVGTCKFLGLLQSQEKSRGGCGMKQSNGTVLVEFLWWGWKYPPTVEFHQLCHTSHLPICHLLLTFLTCRALLVPSVFLWWKCLWFTTFSSFAALYFTPGSSFSFPAQLPGELRLQENYPGVEKGHFCLCWVWFSASCPHRWFDRPGYAFSSSAPQIGRKAGRTRDLRYKLLLYSQPVKNLISSGNNNPLKLRTEWLGKIFTGFGTSVLKNLELPAGKAYLTTFGFVGVRSARLCTERMPRVNVNISALLRKRYCCSFWRCHTEHNLQTN